ncbi:MAG: hypothetical protein ACE37N_04405 [Pseudohongiellaceae bacterium]
MTDLRPFTHHLIVLRRKWLRMTAASRALLALCTIVVLAQGVELTHSHDDLQSQLDCHICLKLGNKGKAVTAAALDFSAENGSTLFVSADRHLPFTAVPPARSRAPPHYS